MSHHQHRLRIPEGRGACGPDAPFAIIDVRCGAVAHLGERFNGIEEVEGSIPSSSTTHLPLSISTSAPFFCYRFLAHNYELGDEIYLAGFSPGMPE